jgi:hypothetical protein
MISTEFYTLTPADWSREMVEREAGEVESNIIQAATLYCNRGCIGTQGSDEDRFDYEKFTNLIKDLLCVRDEVLYLPESRNCAELVRVIAMQVEAPEGSSLIEIRHLVQLFLKWNDVLSQSTIQRAGGENLPSLADSFTMQDLIELHRQREVPIPFHSHRAQNWVYTSGDLRGTAVPPEMIHQSGDWRFSNHGDGTGLLYSWPGAKTPDGQRELLHGECVGRLVQRTSSLGAPSLRKICEQPIEVRRSPRFVDVVEIEMGSNNMVSDSHINLPTGEPDPRLRLEAEVNTRIQSLGYTAVEVGSGGDCFFRCLSAQHPFFNFQPSDENSLLARQLIVEYLTNHQSLYVDFIVYEGQTPDYQAYLQQLSQPNTWIEGGLEVLAAAIVFNVRIHIFGSNPDHDRVVNPHESSEGTRDVYMVHYHDYHYRVLQQSIPS